MNVQDYFIQAQLALAAYGDLQPGALNSADLVKDSVGMSPTQAAAFASKWQVIDQYTHTEEVPVYDDGGNITSYTTRSNGLSVTLFEEIGTGKRHVAIRGTKVTDIGDLTADGGLLLLGIPQLSSQYQSLKSKIEAWQANDALPGMFTVTGHSLGGWLAQGLAKDFEASIEHTYVYNAPGVGGVSLLDELLQQLNEALGTSFLSAPNLANLTNLFASTDISPIPGIGLSLSPPIGILIEDQSFSDVSDPPSSYNHSQRVLTDSLAVYALFAGVSSALTVENIGTILNASGNRNAMTLEDAVNALGDLFGAGTEIAGDGNLDDLYKRMQDTRGRWRIAA